MPRSIDEALLTAISSLNLALAAGITVLVLLLMIQRQRRPLKILIAAFYLLMSYGLMTGWLARSGMMLHVPWLLYSTYVASFIHGPVMYLYARDDDASILDIAFEVGFNSKTTFNTLFSRATGLTPKEFRRKSVKTGKEAPKKPEKRSIL